MSAASGWEIATKVRLGKLPAAVELLDDLPELLTSQGFEVLPIQLQHGLHAGSYSMAHRDPFDRLLGRPGRTGQPHPGESGPGAPTLSLPGALVIPVRAAVSCGLQELEQGL